MTDLVRVALVATALFGLAACGPALESLPASGGSAAPSFSDSGAKAEYTLGSEDKIRLTVFGEEQLSGEFLVDSSGSVSLPLIGEVRAGGLTLRQFEAGVSTKLKQGYLQDPKVNAEVINFRPIYVIGEVSKPGQYPYVSNMTLQKAVALASGYTYRANESSAEITRNGRKFRAEGASTPLLPGDEIRIFERYF
jgi:protein involved in polysaccharide export with SLBB domain